MEYLVLLVAGSFSGWFLVPSILRTISRHIIMKIPWELQKYQ